MLIVSLARECKCEAVTVRKWAKNNHCRVFQEPAYNNRNGRALSTSDCQKFKSYWKERITAPNDHIIVTYLARECNVDRNTILWWAKKHKVELYKLPVFNTRPSNAISKADADKFIAEYCSPTGSVPVMPLLKKYKCDWRVAIRWAAREEKSFVKAGNNGRKQKGLLPADAKQFEEYLKDIKSRGFFYMIQPIPEYNPNRIKFGFGYDVVRRMGSHKSVCPNLNVLATWPCQRHLEKKAIRAITKKVKCIAIADELFECDDYAQLLHSANEYFQL